MNLPTSNSLEDTVSKYHRTQTQYKDRECLVKALNDMGYEHVEVHDDAVQLGDWHGHTTHYFDPTGDKANIIVRRRFIGGLPNDLGFLWNAETKSFDSVISEYDGNKHNSSWLGRLTAKYAAHRVQKSVKALGFVNKVAPVRKNGKLILQVVR